MIWNIVWFALLCIFISTTYIEQEKSKLLEVKADEYEKLFEKYLNKYLEEKEK